MYCAAGHVGKQRWIWEGRSRVQSGGKGGIRWSVRDLRNCQMFLFYRAPLKIISRFCDWHFLTSSPDALEVCIRGCEARTNPTQQNAVQMQLGKGFSGAMYWKSLKHLKTLLNNTPISYAPYDPYVHSLSPPHVCCRYSPLVFSCTLFLWGWQIVSAWGCSQGACLPPPIVLLSCNSWKYEVTKSG